MKKNYLFSFLLTAFNFVFSFGQVIITEVADPDNNTSARYIELTNIGQDAFDLTGYNLIRWTNAYSDPTSSSEKDLSSYGPVAAGAVLTFAANATEFENVYGFAPTANFGTGGVADSNGDDNIALRNGTTVYDIFGVPGEDGTGTAHEFEDGRAERKATVIAPNPTWDASEWNVDNDSGGGDGPQDAPGGFDPGEWIGLTPSSDPTLSISSPGNNATFYTNQVEVSLSVENFTVANGTGDGHIHYVLNQDQPVMKYDTNSFTLTGLSEGLNTLVVSLVDNNHDPLSPAVEATKNFTIDIPSQVSNINELRLSAEGEAIEVTGEMILTYQQSFRNAKVFQDNSAGIYIDDASGIITSSYNLGDGITGLTGTLSTYGGLLQFTPISDPGAASSTSNEVSPVTLTLSQLTSDAENYESQLVKVENITVTGDGGETTFINGKVYTLAQDASTFPMRTTFYNFSGEALPTSTFDLEGVITERSDIGLHLAPRAYSDVTLSIIKFNDTEIFVYPNPVKSNLNFLGLANSVQVSVYDMTGRLYFQKEVTNTLDVSSLKAGIYMVKIQNESGSKVFNILKN